MELNTIFANRYRLIKKLGAGGFSEVWQVADTEVDDTIEALKVYLPNKQFDEEGVQQLKREYLVVKDIRHPHLLTAAYLGMEQGKPFLVMPYCSGGSAYHQLKNSGVYTERKIAQLLFQVADGLAFLHSKGVIHQDVKPDNVLIDSMGNYLLTDFGISTKQAYATGSSTSRTIPYSPPERFASQPEALIQGDIFSLGVMIYELCTGELPWKGQGGKMLKQDSELPRLSDNYSTGLTDIMQACMHYWPEARPDAEEVKRVVNLYCRTERWNPVIVRSTIPIPGGGRTIGGTKRPDPPVPLKEPMYRKPLIWLSGVVAIFSVSLLVFLQLKENSKKNISETPSAQAPIIYDSVKEISATPDTSKVKPDIVDIISFPAYQNLDEYVNVITDTGKSIDFRSGYAEKNKHKALKEFTDAASVQLSKGEVITDYYKPEEYFKRLLIQGKKVITREKKMKDDKIDEWIVMEE